MGVREPVAMEIPVEEGAAARVPPQIRRRLLEGSTSGGGGPASAKEIEAKLKEADHRRQQFYDWLSCKARKKPRSPSWSSQEEDYGQYLEAKLQAAEQKRLSLLAKAQNRLAKLDELRQAAKNDVEMRIEKEKEELETRVETRVRQAEENRMHLLHADMQRRAALKERTERSLVQKATSESKYTERVQSAILEKRAAAEKKRLALLEAEKRKAHARIMHIQQADMTVSSQREAERIILKEHLESKLQRKRKRDEYLKQRGGPCSSAHADYIKHADFLSRKLARCWRSFVKSRKTTLALAQAYDALGINEKSVKSMPFEELAMLMGSSTVLEATKALLDRFERRVTLCQSASSSSAENIDHLLKRLVTPKRKVPPSRDGRTRVAAKRPARTSETSRLSRYSLRVALCAYMILAHPSAVLSGDGEQETLLMESAANFVREFELLVKTTLEGPGSASRQPFLDAAESCSYQKSDDVAGQSKFKTRLVNFDKAWCTYLYRFVVWKVKDARSLEGDLVRTACKLELSMMQTCKLTADGRSHNLTHDMKAIQKQVSDDHKLLREKVQHLSGDAGIERMDSALSDARSKFFEAKENGSPLAAPVANVSTPLSIDSSGKLPPSEVNVSSETASSSTSPVNLPTENEQMVNEMLHEDSGVIAGNSNDARTIEKDFQDKVRDTMEKAFWDVVTDSMKGDKPDYSQLINLVKEVRDSLHDLAPKGWKEEIYENIDLEILSQVLESGSQDTQYLGQILQYSLDMVRKLSAAAKDDEMKASHDKLLSELAASSEDNDNGVSSFVIAVIKGLRFTLEEIKQLQVEVSKAYVQLMQPMIKGSAGVEYLQKAFGDRCGPPANASASLPVSLQWISASKSIMDAEWREHLGSLSVLPAANHAQPLVTVLRAGHGAPTAAVPSAGTSGLPECKGEKVDKLVRVGLLQLISCMEGLQLESTPESFHLNFLRLRAVQGQFQEVIVISTSMLVLRQVLMSENSKITPPELEAVISELFGALAKLLDNSPEAGTEEIVEAMMSASASAGSLSDAKIQARRQIITRGLLKSLQADDVVFKKVSRAVHCAFRGVVLSGSGAKGQKLADAALRRVGAGKLADRVVKAAEVLIRVATVSEKVHGPWYKALA
ncbi:unnamed protein product [Triticum turgidum subsp. durum]|uniref:T-complex protein 11 n=1 Tax=Triticum turgidum subsp. durum TaxID=4567 RepID=A0A9R1R8X3_TRITD|nr:unnamed protein product [Triticum turgidum subsp. durum]